MCVHLSHKITKEFTCCGYLDMARLSGDTHVMHMSTSLTYFGYATLDQVRRHLMPFSKSVLPGDNLRDRFRHECDARIW